MCSISQLWLNCALGVTLLWVYKLCMTLSIYIYIKTHYTTFLHNNEGFYSRNNIFLRWVDLPRQRTTEG